MINKLKTSKGITLIALVITIIVLLILAGVAISMLTGDNGILRQATNAKTKTEDSAQNELDILNGYEQEINERTMVKVNGKSTKNGGRWEFDSTTGTITNYLEQEDDKSSEIVIPNYVDGIKVKKLQPNYYTGFSGFYTNDNIKKIIISEGIQEIGNGCFPWIPKLESVILPNSLLKIGDDAFDQCESLTSVEIPSNVIIIGEHAFSRCTNLEKVTIKEKSTTITNTNWKDYDWYGFTFYDYYDDEIIKDMSGLTVIKAYAFSNCSNLTNIEIPSTVIGIGEDAFKYCTNLEKITIKKGSTLSANSEGYPWGADESKITFEK